ncbi:serine kinase [Rhodophyticola sp. CCM32]|uniref:serine kinase n=1 Tax=Rhodophyticola sp. CCM32 TaxID=2916397 RepID=UPI00107FA3BC|nr:serine kinase [Rhodophyticola sp. CCM32]QBY02305.1 serine kinase [Rhodophyticola sp. CCM32]
MGAAPDLICPLDAYGTAFDTYLHCHGTAVSLAGQGLLLLGASGSGKSALALALMAHGAVLIADDGVRVTRVEDILTLHRPATAPPLIEARHMGLLAAEPASGPVPLRLAVDLDQPEPARLPPRRAISWGAACAPLIHGAGQPMLWAALIQYLRGGYAG